MYTIYFCIKDNFQKELIELLEKEKIKYKKYECEPGPLSPAPFLNFEFTSRHPQCKYILGEIAKFNVKVAEIFGYTAKEINNAKYLEIWPRIGIFEYANIIRKTQMIEVEKDGKKVICNSHCEQVEPIIFAKKPKENSIALWQLPNSNIILANKYVRELVEDNNLTGMVFNDVYVGKTKKEKSDYLFQITALDPIGAESMPEDFGSRKFERFIHYCPICQQSAYSLEQLKELRFDYNKISLTNDLYITKAIFCDDEKDDPEERYWKWSTLCGFMIISQRFYRLLKGNNLLKGVQVFPICED